MGFPAGRFIVDAHEDLACHCQQFGRELDSADGCSEPVMITLPMLQQAGVRLVCATLFVPHELPYRERNYKLFSQYEMYLEWFSRFDRELRMIRSRTDLTALGESEPLDGPGPERYPVGFILLMEGLDLLTSPAELSTWYERGVRMASITWNGQNMFASGCYSDMAGLKPPGFELLQEFARLGMVLDLAHLNDAGIADVFMNYDGPVCATHSNARQVASHQRNLTDPQIRELAKRNGVIGLNLLAPLVQHGWKKPDPQPPLTLALQHLQHIAGLAGPQHVGFGSDLDGGLTPDNTPEGVNTILDLQLILNGLADAGWSATDLAACAGRNWWSFFKRSLPA